jgi:hypothetical protein
MRSKLSGGSAKTGAGFGFGFLGKPDSNVFARSAGIKKKGLPPPRGGPESFLTDTTNVVCCPGQASPEKRKEPLIVRSGAPKKKGGPLDIT